MELLHEECKQYLNKDFVFKRCTKFIVILQKPKIFKEEKPIKIKDEKKCKKPKDNEETKKLAFIFQSNEMREGIVDKSYAKFRCNQLMTIDIIEVKTLLHPKKIIHEWNNEFHNKEVVYEVGKMVVPDFYDKDITKVCACGIHYFLTLEAAFYYNHFPLNGKCFLFYHNGSKKAEWTNKNGQIDGIKMEWKKNWSIFLKE